MPKIGVHVAHQVKDFDDWFQNFKTAPVRNDLEREYGLKTPRVIQDVRNPGHCNVVVKRQMLTLLINFGMIPRSYRHLKKDPMNLSPLHKSGECSDLTILKTRMRATLASLSIT